MRLASSLNPSEIAHFSRLASQWWLESGELALLHRMNPVRVRYIRDTLTQATRDDGNELKADAMRSSPHILRGLDALDIGCGGGLLSESLAKLGATTLGIDLSPQNIGIATAHAARDPQLSSLRYRHTAAETLVQEQQRFDLVCLMEVLEHVDNPAQFLRNCADLVKPGGHLFLSTMARTPLSYFLTIFMAETVFGLVSPGTHTYSKYVDPSEVVEFFHKDVRWLSAIYDGLPTRREADVRGISYTPWTGTWTLLPRHMPGALHCNYLFWARKPMQPHAC